MARLSLLPVIQLGQELVGITEAASWRVRLALREVAGAEGRASGALAYRWDFKPGNWRSLRTHRGVGEQGEVGRGEVGVGRSGRADAPSSSGSRI